MRKLLKRYFRFVTGYNKIDGETIFVGIVLCWMLIPAWLFRLGLRQLNIIGKWIDN